VEAFFEEAVAAWLFIGNDRKINRSDNGFCDATTLNLPK
jgi:hypothetical protein